MAELIDMELQIAKLKQQLEKQSKDLNLAGEIGKQLLEANSELSSKIESDAKKHSAIVETLEQEKYSLQLKLEQRQHMEQSLSEELESLRSELKKHKESHKQFIEVEYPTKISELKKQKQDVENDLEKAQQAEKKLKDTIKSLQAEVADTQDQLKMQMNRLNETCSDETAALHTQLAQLEAEKASLLRELGELQALVEASAGEHERLRSAVAEQHEEAQQAQCQATSYYNTLERAREEVQELKVELDMARMESQDQKKKGNSLFSEVEDRRIEAEKNLISLKVKFNDLDSRHQATKQQLHKLKFQIAGLLQMSGGRADTDYMESLQQQLSKAQSQIQELVTKLTVYENKEKTRETYATEFKEKFGEQANSSNFVNFLNALLENKDKELKAVQDELQIKRLHFLSKSNDLLQCERKLYAAQKQTQQLQGNALKLQVKVEELQLKYEPHKIKGGVRKGNREVLPKRQASEEKTENKENEKIGDDGGDVTETPSQVLQESRDNIPVSEGGSLSRYNNPKKISACVKEKVKKDKSWFEGKSENGKTTSETDHSTSQEPESNKRDEKVHRYDRLQKTADGKTKPRKKVDYEAWAAQLGMPELLCKTTRNRPKDQEIQPANSKLVGSKKKTVSIAEDKNEVFECEHIENEAEKESLQKRREAVNKIRQSSNDANECPTQ